MILGNFEETYLSEALVEVELLVECRQYADASRRIEQILAEHPNCLPAKKALQEIYRLTGRGMRAKDLAREIAALAETRAKQQLSVDAPEEYASIQAQRLADRVDRLIRFVHQGGSLNELLVGTADILLEDLKADRCLVLFTIDGDFDKGHFEHLRRDVRPCLEPETVEFLFQWTGSAQTLDESLIARDCSNDTQFERFWPLIKRHDIQTLMACPLIHRSTRIGWLVMLQSVSYYQWTEDELTLCRTAAGHLATAIENLRHVERLSGIAFRDGLTGLYNRHFLEERLRVELANAQEQKAALSLAILDIDHFKQINDTFGHAAGDSVLLNLASLLKQSSYPSCFVARWGGEEFVAVFPGFDLGAAVLVMEKLRAKISEVVKIERQDVTISVGVAEADLTTSAPLAQIESDLFATADARLYSAKQRGRNRIVSEGPSPNINELPKDSDEMRSEG